MDGLYDGLVEHLQVYCLVEQAGILDRYGSEACDTGEGCAQRFQVEVVLFVAAQVQRSHGLPTGVKGQEDRHALTVAVEFGQVFVGGDVVLAGVDVVRPAVDSAGERGVVQVALALLRHTKRVFWGHFDLVQDVTLFGVVLEGNRHVLEGRKAQHVVRDRFHNVIDVEGTGNVLQHLVEHSFLLCVAHTFQVESVVFNGCRRLMRENFQHLRPTLGGAAVVLRAIHAHDAEQFSASTCDGHKQHVAIAPSVGSLRMDGAVACVGGAQRI